MVNFLKLSFLLFSVSLVCSIPIPQNNDNSFDLDNTDIKQSKIVYDSQPKVINQEDIEHLKKIKDNDSIYHSRKLLKKSKSFSKKKTSSPELTKPFPIYMTCDNEFSLYVNGVIIGSGNTWTTTYHFSPIVKDDDIIAIDGIDRGGVAAFIGVFDGKVTKPSYWKCSPREESGWNKNNFNDDSWAQAVSYGKNQDNNIWRSVSSSSRPNIPDDAEWLWTSNNENHNRVYCRYNRKEIVSENSIKNDEERLKQLIKDSKDTHNFSSEKIQKLKINIKNLIENEISSKEKELNEFNQTIFFSEEEFKKLNNKYDNKISELNALNKSIIKLEETIHIHYKQMLSDAKYLNILDNIKPNFLKTLTSYNEQITLIKDTININIIEGDDKKIMLHIIYEMNNKNTNYTNFLTKEFLDHYEKYKQKAGLDKAEYDKEYRDLEVLKTKYEEEIKLRDNYLAEYENAKKILKQLQSNYDMDTEDIEAFKKLEEIIEKIFINNSC